HCQAEHSRNSAQALDVHSLPQRLNEETMEDSRRDLQNDHLNSLVPDVRVDRRGFVAACLAAGFAVTAEPVLAQAIKTSMKGMDAGVAWYGGLGATPPAMTRTPLDIVEQLNAQVLGLYGGADQGIPPEQVEKLREALKKSRSPKARQSEIHVYEGMPHGFNA